MQRRHLKDGVMCIKEFQVSDQEGRSKDAEGTSVGSREAGRKQMQPHQQGNPWNPPPKRKADLFCLQSTLLSMKATRCVSCNFLSY